MELASGNFNTSHVSINLIPSQGKRVRLEISIHLMFLLIKVQRQEIRVIRTYFNTSHVSINLYLPISALFFSRYFNTSHVSINRRFTGSRYSNL